MNILERKLELLEIELNGLERKCLHVKEKIILLKDLIKESNDEDIYGEGLSEEKLYDIECDEVFRDEKIKEEMLIEEFKSSLYEKGSVNVTKM